MAAVSAEAAAQLRGARAPPQPGRAVRRQRGRPAGGDDGRRSAAGDGAAVSASCCPSAIARGRHRRAVRPFDALGRRLSRSGPAAASPTTTASAPTCARSPTRARAEVRFAAECLAFANVPDEAGIAELTAAAGRRRAPSGAGSAGCRATSGAGWDFEDVRDHYLGAALRRRPGGAAHSDPERYLELSRQVSGEVDGRGHGRVAARRLTLRGRTRAVAARPRAGRRAGACSTTAASQGGLSPPAPGAGAAGRLEHRRGTGRHRRPRRQRRPRGARATLRLALYRDREARRRGGARARPRSAYTEAHNVEALLGRFIDAAWAYRFGPPAQSVITASLWNDTDDRPISSSAYFPAGIPTARATAARSWDSGARSRPSSTTARRPSASRRTASSPA